MFHASLQQIDDNTLRDPFNGQSIKYRVVSSSLTIYSAGRTGKYDDVIDPPGWKEAKYQISLPCPVLVMTGAACGSNYCAAENVSTA